MSGSVNKTILVGNLGADPEVKSFQNGNRIANLRLATGESWKDKATGEQKEKTEWHSVTLNSDGLVSVAERFLRKGSKVYIEGKLQTRKWQHSDGSDRYTTEIVVGGFDGKLVMLDGAKGRENEGWPDSGAGSDTGAQQQANYQSSGFADDLDQDVPFASADPRFEGCVF